MLYIIFYMHCILCLIINLQGLVGTIQLVQVCYSVYIVLNIIIYELKMIIE